MLARTLNLTLHGLGVPGPGTCPSIARYWLSVARFERLLWQMPVVEAAYGISIALTFDDANRSDFEIARPLLQRYRRSAIMFVPTGAIGTDGRLTGAEIRELAAAGFGIGSHGHRHIDMRTAAEPVLGDELAGSRRRLEDLLGCEVRDLSFPFGTFDARVLREARRAGFRRLFTSAGGFASAAQGLVSRVSLKSDFFPESDLAALARPTERIRSTLIDHLRRAKYAALELA